MRIRLLLSTLIVCLLIGLAATLVVQAQSRGVAERTNASDGRYDVRLPGDDEADDEDEDGDTPTPPAPVPATGQVDCFDEYGVSNGCYGTGADAEYRMGVTTVPRFTTHPDGTITDGLTGLVWLRSADCLGEGTWGDALFEASVLAEGACGLTDGSLPGDWRLPNVRELQSLIDYGREFPALPPDHPFLGVQSSWYWSSSSKAFTPIDAWRIDFGVGSGELSAAVLTGYVLPVRGGVPPEHHVCDGSLTSCDCCAPDCPPGEVPSVVNSCWGPCVKIEDCLPW